MSTNRLLIKSKGGTNTSIIKAYFNGINVIIKQFGYIPITNKLAPRLKLVEVNKLIDDFNQLRNAISNSEFKVPNIITIQKINDNLADTDFENLQETDFDTFRILIIETDCGNSLKDLILNKKLNHKQLNSYVDIISKLMFSLPEGIEIDTNPANFVVKDQDIYFVDFMPPKIWKYQTNKRLIKLFPQIKQKTIAKELRRIRRYNTNKGRLERFKYYLNLITNQTQTTNNTQPNKTY
jgi:hypothetical protein